MDTNSKPIGNGNYLKFTELRKKLGLDESDLNSTVEDLANKLHGKDRQLMAQFIETLEDQEDKAKMASVIERLSFGPTGASPGCEFNKRSFFSDVISLFESETAKRSESRAKEMRPFVQKITSKKIIDLLYSINLEERDLDLRPEKLAEKLADKNMELILNLYQELPYSLRRFGLENALQILGKRKLAKLETEVSVGTAQEMKKGLDETNREDFDFRTLEVSLSDRIDREIIEYINSMKMIRLGSGSGTQALVRKAGMPQWLRAKENHKDLFGLMQSNMPATGTVLSRWVNSNADWNIDGFEIATYLNPVDAGMLFPRGGKKWNYHNLLFSTLVVQPDYFPMSGLSADELVALFLYRSAVDYPTAPGAPGIRLDQAINAAITHDNKESLSNFEPIIKSVRSALTKLPDGKGIFYQSTTFSKEELENFRKKLKDKTNLTFAAFTLVSKSEALETGYSHQYRFLGRHAKDLSSYGFSKGTYGTVFAPDARFKVIGVQTQTFKSKPDQVRITLEEEALKEDLIHEVMYQPEPVDIEGPLPKDPTHKLHRYH